jgi:hypothetical protein
LNRPFVYADGKLTLIDADPLDLDYSVSGNGINDHGVIVGSILYWSAPAPDDGNQPIIYRNGKAEFPDSGYDGSAWKVNNAGDVIGVDSVDYWSGLYHGFVYSNGKVTTLCPMRSRAAPARSTISARSLDRFTTGMMATSHSSINEASTRRCPPGDRPIRTASTAGGTSSALPSSAPCGAPSVIARA